MNQKKWIILKLDFQNNWQPIGPLTPNEVKEKLKIGEFKPTDYCWVSGWKDWKKIFEESEFFLTQKAPIEIKSNPNNDVGILSSDGMNSYSEAGQAEVEVEVEVPIKTSPLQYFGWKYKMKKTLQSPDHGVNQDSNQSNDGHRHSKMPEPWESEIKKLNFLENQSVRNSLDLDLNSTDLNQENKPGPKLLNWLSISVLILTAVFLLTYYTYEIYNKYSVDNKINLNLSYFVIEDLTADLPRYMYARSDLKKGQSIKIRLFDAKGIQIKTQNNKSGLTLVSQGTGRIRVPIYPFKIESGIYTLNIEIEGQILEKEFQVSI